MPAGDGLGLLAGRTTADLCRNVIVVVILTVIGYLVGFRVQTNVLEFLAGWLANRFVITGPPEHCIKGLQGLIDAGATKFMIPQVLPNPMASTRLLGEQVFPAFR